MMPILFEIFNSKLELHNIWRDGRILAVIQSDYLCSEFFHVACFSWPRYFIAGFWPYCKICGTQLTLLRWGSLAECLVVPVPIIRSERLPFGLHMVFVCPVKLSSLCIYMYLVVGVDFVFPFSFLQQIVNVSIFPFFLPQIVNLYICFLPSCQVHTRW